MRTDDEARSPRHGRRRGALRGGPARTVVVAVALVLGAASGLWVGTRPGAGPDDAATAAVLGADERGGAVSRDDGSRPGATPTGSTGAGDVRSGSGVDASPGSDRAAGAADGPTSPPSPTPPPGLSAQDVADGLLGAEIPPAGPGTFGVAPGTDAGPETGTVRVVRVEVEDGLPVDATAFAATVMATLNDPRGWGADGSVSFARTDGEAELRVVLASPATVDVLCAPLPTAGEVSCGRAGRAVINAERWLRAVEEYGGDLHRYRQYVVNHEVGHLLGHAHEQCPGAGLPAPVMQQQTYAVAPCTPNAWPFP